MPGLVAAAITECRARTGQLLPLPDGERVGCEIVPDADYIGMGMVAVPTVT
ncbi:hypothetical protein [Actinophytocola algeriensis]|uniref:Uncharacterized protein n=1 Tax=Actinophytocola algeriensis TaxID=1768010 RepID=A0A7W7PZN0_9PSEU|nr:hypothetical protein [Actinophytocola algeriensis]MBB4904282.1 hypothetical protein [Actinophytocola algeriensis]MBE1476860.1 hypothetical protein [Actinophytocola algeriensis]